MNPFTATVTPDDCTDEGALTTRYLELDDGMDEWNDPWSRK